MRALKDCIRLGSPMPIVAWLLTPVTWWLWQRSRRAR